MECKWIQQMLPAHQDGELSAGNEKTVRAHLDVCATCHKEEQLLAASWNRLGELKPINLSPDFQARFWARVRQEELKPTGWKSWLNWQTLMPVALSLTGMAAIWVIGVTSGMMLFENHNRREAALLKASSVFTSPYPPNSIEQVFMQAHSTLKETLL